jgi:cytidylate kinase
VSPRQRAEVIAIDGPAGAGKSSTASGVARALGFRHVDSGGFYRAAALLALRHGLAGGEAGAGADLARLLRDAEIEQLTGPSGNRTLLNGEDVTEALRKPAVSAVVSRVAASPDVRRVVTRKLRATARGGAVVMDGRDIGSVVFPRARLKVYLDAAVEERARRRSDADRRAVAPQTLERRDGADRSRSTAPLARAPDAVVIRTDDLTLEEQVRRIVALFRDRTGARG